MGFVIDPIKDVAEGKLLSAACKVAKLCRAFEKFGGRLLDGVFDRIRVRLTKAPDGASGNFGSRSVGAAQNPAGIVSGNLKTLKKGRLRNARLDAEAAKAADLGSDAGNFNISVDGAGNVFYVPVIKGAGDPIPAFRTLDEIAEEFPLKYPLGR